MGWLRVRALTLTLTYDPNQVSIGYFGLNETALELVAARARARAGPSPNPSPTLVLALVLALTLNSITLALTRRCHSGWAPTTCLWSTTRRRSMARLGLGLG